ncbi:MAG: hypothetical protein H6922_04320 [Pseudomonadaceae bacterium]|nr:hypothetical protein [Pseudomonadaceae bacterium]
MNQHLRQLPVPHAIGSEARFRAATPDIQNLARSDTSRVAVLYARHLLKDLARNGSALNTARLAELRRMTGFALLGLNENDLAAARKYAGPWAEITPDMQAAGADPALSGIEFLKHAKMWWEEKRERMTANRIARFPDRPPFAPTTGQGRLR